MIRRKLAIILLAAGATLLIGVGGPIFYSQLTYSITAPPKLLDPSSVSGSDYTNVTSWFDQSNQSITSPQPSGVTHFLLTIGKINLNNVLVEVNGADLKENAIHFPGSALPGQFGNTVIFGHSTLPQLYKVQDPLSIFNPLPKVKMGDEINISYDGIAYKYVVRETLEVKPNQVEVLDQKLDRHELTIITCVPLGTYLRRFVVKAELVK
jgi:sortase A